MDVVSTCPLTVGSVLWQPRAGTWALTFVCKATYELAPAESPLAAEQEAPYEDDNHWNDDTTRSLYAASDLVPFKARADVILVGHAFAPMREPVRSLVAHLMVGQMSKAIECSCDRSYSLDGQLREGPRFTKIPLRYERAAGGPDTTNPVGMRPDAGDAYGAVALPNLLAPGEPLPKRGEVIKPIGFGPLAPTWPTRAEKLGRHAASWSSSEWNQRPLPDDLDPAYFNCAPLDQRVAAIRPGERLVLENLHPDHPRLVTNLQRTVPVARLERPGAEPEDVRLKCDTLWIDTDRALCTLVFRGRVALEGQTQKGRIVISLEGRASAQEPLAQTTKLTWSDPASAKETGAGQRAKPAKAGAAGGRAASGAHEEEDETFVTSMEQSGASDVLPFVQPGGLVAGAPPFAPPKGKPGAPPAPLASLAARAPQPPREEEHDNTVAWNDSTAVQAAMLQTTTLPFQPRPSLHSIPAIDMGAPGARPADSAAPYVAPPPLTPMQARPAPPPLVRPPTTVDPIPPVAAPSSPWATGAPPRVAPAPAPMPSAPIMAPPSIASEPTPQGAVFLPLKSDAPAPAPLSPAVVAAAATAGAAAASNAAARGARAPSPSTPGISIAAPAAPAARPMGRDVLTLLWFDPACVKLLPDEPRWAEILAKPEDDAEEGSEKEKAKAAAEAAKMGVSGDEEGLVADEDDEIGDFEPPEPPPPPPEPQEVRDKKQVFRVLARAEPKTAAGLHQAVADAIRKDGTLEPPLALLSGELLFPFDELETLKATVTAVAPLCANDKKLKEVVDTVNELLKTPWLSRSGSVAEGLTSRVKEAFGQGNRMLPPSYLDSHTERVLLEERHYQKRTVFGKTWIRSLFNPAGGQDAIPTYLPEALAKQLPMFQRLRVRFIAEVNMQQDQYESQPIALCVVALARVTALAPVPAR